MIDLATKLAPVDGYDLESMDDELVIYHAVTESIFYCNPTAALIYRLCDGQRTVGELIAALEEAYPEAKAQIAVEVQQTLDQLVEHGALAAS